MLTGFIANVFLAPDRPRRRARAAPGRPPPSSPQLVELMRQQERQTAAIRAKMHDLERALFAAKLVPAGEDPPRETA